jgi:YD repeat-containing protein
MRLNDPAKSAGKQGHQMVPLCAYQPLGGVMPHGLASTFILPKICAPSEIVDGVSFYETAGNLTSATDSSGKTSMTYDPNTNLLTRITYPGGQFFTFEYDAAGRRTKRTDQDGHVENSTYDAAGRLSTMTDENGALIVRYEYDAAGRLTKKTRLMGSDCEQP